jgi:iron(III) transport system permease protein
MTPLRLLLGGLLVALVGLPLALPLGEVFHQGNPANLWENRDYLAFLAWNTLALVAGTLLLSMPLGTLGAILLFRTDLPLRQFWIVICLLILFVPLPLLLSAWQALLGSDGYFPVLGWEINTTRNWSVGLLPAIWVHSLAGLPWVILIIGNGLTWVEKELEEEAFLFSPPWQVVSLITLPRCWASLLAAALWLAFTTFSEITVTYFLQVTTFAEEIQTQFSGGNPQAMAQGILLSLPLVLPLLILLLVWVPRLEKDLPPLQSWIAPSRPLRLGRGKWFWAWLVSLLATAFLLFPLLGLVWKVGLAGQPQFWSLTETLTRLGSESRVAGNILLKTLLTAGGTALLTALISLACCWLAKDSRWLRGLVLVLLALAMAFPGPVIGIGLKEAIDLVGYLRMESLDDWLYRGPSPLPIMWAQFIRFLPVGVILFWPLVRRVPRELLEEARLAGARPIQEMTQVIWPLLRPHFGGSVLILMALCLGEVSASNRVETPGWETFAKIILDRMHYGVDSTVAALCLLLLGFLMLLGILGIGGLWIWSPRKKA